MSNGIQYQNDHITSRGRVATYHGKPSPREMQKGAKQSDIAALKTADKRNFISVGDDVNAKFTIGFEIEKNQLSRGAVRQYPLFAGFERDGSCGYEAVTNILPLLPAGQWRNKVYNMFVEAGRIIEDAYSPSDYRCGGHITIGVEGMNGYELQQAIRKNAGIIYALFRKRLSNGFCRYDIFMDALNAQGLYVNNPFKYRVSKVMDNCVEFRLPSRVQSVKQMMRRYELFYEIVDFSVNNPNGSYTSLLKKVTPIIKSMYAGDMDKVNEILDLAKAFRTMILTKKVNRKVLPFVDPRNDLDVQQYYDRDLQQNGYRLY